MHYVTIMKRHSKQQHLQLAVDGEFDDVQLLGLQRVEVKVAVARYGQERSRVEQIDSGPGKVARARLWMRGGRGVGSERRR